MIFGIDPGTRQSGWVCLSANRVTSSGVSPNEHVLERIRAMSGYASVGMLEPTTLAIERYEARGMPTGEDSIETILWTGRFWQAWHKPKEVRLVLRRFVKLTLCGSTKAKDPNVRQALIDRFGGKEAAIGSKKAPGPLYGVSSHAWAALGVAVVTQGAAV